MMSVGALTSILSGIKARENDHTIKNLDLVSQKSIQDEEVDYFPCTFYDIVISHEHKRI